MESSHDNPCFVNQDMREESQTELLLDVIGDNEPVTVRLDQLTGNNPITIITEQPKEEEYIQQNQISNKFSIKSEEFDVDDFLSSEMDEPSCPTSPESQPSSPSSSETSTDFDELIKLCTNDETSLVGDTANNGFDAIKNSFIDDEFFMSCDRETIENNACDIVDIDDPFSELFPSLLSV